MECSDRRFEILVRPLKSDAEQIVRPERRGRVSQLTWSGGGCCDSRRPVNSIVGCPRFGEKMSLTNAPQTVFLILLLLPVFLPGFNATYAMGKASARLVQNSPLTQTQSPTNSWSGLVPLRSTREEVEKLLGKSKMSHGFTYIYENQNERVDVLYSAGPCEPSGVERWNVPQDVVISMEVIPRKTILIKDLHLDPKKYVRFQWSHPDNWVDYWNREEGVIVHSIIWDKAEELRFLEYRPTVKDGTLRCE